MVKKLKYRSSTKIYSKGEALGDLIFIEEVESGRKRQALFMCRCGNTFLSRIDQAIEKKRISCGCFRRSRAGKNTRHGMTYSPTYHIWCKVKERCYNPNLKAYPDYGGRGIIMCDRWKNSFENFLADMGEKPNKDSSIDRTDVNGIYEPSNCKWIERRLQPKNRRNCYLELNGVRKTNEEWAIELGISKKVIATRKNRGLSVEQILKPIKRKSWKNLI